MPSYREVHGEIRADDSYRGGSIPVIIKDTQTAELLSSKRIGQPIGELEHVLSTGGPDQELVINFPPTILQKVFVNTLANEAIPTLTVSRSQPARILDAVRNIFLDWALKLEKEGILGENLQFSSNDKQAAASITNNYINSFSGVLGNITGDTVNVGVYTTIYKQLAQKGLPASETNEIKDILEKTKTAQPDEKKHLIKRTWDWLHKNGQSIGDLFSWMLLLASIFLKKFTETVAGKLAQRLFPTKQRRRRKKR